jgi:hypothetical protein
VSLCRAGDRWSRVDALRWLRLVFATARAWWRALSPACCVPAHTPSPTCPAILCLCCRIRNVVLDIWSKLPPNEMLEPHLAELMAVLVGCLTSDNEDNALVCVRIIFELFKGVRLPIMEVRARLSGATCDVLV